jgi:hypothetical protein
MSNQSPGGRATAIKLRTQALQRYYRAPNRCQHCKEIIKVKGHEPVYEVRRRKFCSHSCASMFHNLKRRVPARRVFTMRCQLCKQSLLIESDCPSSARRRKYCDKCRSLRFAANAVKGNPMNQRTKGEVFSANRSWQSARNSIRKHAYSVYAQSGKPFKCVVWQYDKHVEICHLRSVSSFADSELIATINAPDNLVALCPTHHWEFDHHLLSL